MRNKAFSFNKKSHKKSSKGQENRVTSKSTDTVHLQTFDDDYEFISSAGANYKMIGNAVPPYFSYKLALAIEKFLNKL